MPMTRRQFVRTATGAPTSPAARLMRWRRETNDPYLDERMLKWALEQRPAGKGGE